MISSIKRYFFNKEYHKLNNSNKGDFSEINSISSVVILTDDQSYQMEDIARTVEFLRKQGIRTKGYILTNKIEAQENDHVNIITPESVSWNGVPKQEFLVEWLQRRYDLLIKASRKSNNCIEYLMASSNCLLKTSLVFNEQMDHHAQFSLQVNSSSSHSLKELCTELYAQLLNIFRS